MVDSPFTIALGRTIELYANVKGNNPANSAFIVVLLQASVADDTLADFDDLAALLADAGNTEATFTNYTRKTVTDAELAALPAPDDGGNFRLAPFPDQTFVNAGGATNNTMTKALICYDADTTGGTDANIVPLSQHDFTSTTDGSDITISFPSDWYKAAR